MKKPSIKVAAKTLGARGGKVGGPARAKALSAKERSEIARKGGKCPQGREVLEVEGVRSKGQIVTAQSFFFSR